MKLSGVRSGSGFIVSVRRRNFQVTQTALDPVFVEIPGVNATVVVGKGTAFSVPFLYRHQSFVRRGGFALT